MKTTTYTNTLFLNRNACDNEVLQVRDKANRELEAHLENFRALLAFGDYKACNDYLRLITNTLSYHSASLTLTADRTGHYPSNYNRVEWLFRHLTRTYNMAFSSLIPTYTVKKIEGRCQEAIQQLPLIINPSKVRPLREPPLPLSVCVGRGGSRQLSSIAEQSQYIQAYRAIEYSRRLVSNYEKQLTHYYKQKKRKLLSKGV